MHRGHPGHHIATAFLALVITDPISKSYRLSKAERSGTKSDAECADLFRRTLLSQVFVQLLFIVAVVVVRQRTRNSLYRQLRQSMVSSS